jgi:hypothetical protein
MSDEFLKFEDWEKTVPDYVKKDSLWESLYYRVALYLYDLVWDDCDILEKDFKARNNISQIKSLGCQFIKFTQRKSWKEKQVTRIS